MAQDHQDNLWPPPATSELAGGYIATLAKKSYASCQKDDKQLIQHLHLVQQEVNRIRIALPPQIEVADLVSAGVVGLVQAFRRYDGTTGVSFPAYARQRIRGAIFDELRRADWMSRAVREKAKLITAAIDRIEQEKGRPATDEEVATELGLNLEDYDKLLDEIRPVTLVELDATPLHDDADSHHELVADPDAESADQAAFKKELIELVAARIQQLPPPHRKVLVMYYYEGMKLSEIAQVFGVTESRICQIHAHAVVSLRAYLKRILG